MAKCNGHLLFLPDQHISLPLLLADPGLGWRENRFQLSSVCASGEHLHPFLQPHCLPWRADLWLRLKQTLQPFLLATEIGSKWMCVSSQTKEIQFKEFYWSDWKREFLFPEMNLGGCQPGPSRAALWQTPHSRRKTETNSHNKLEQELNPGSCHPKDGSFSSIQEIIRSPTHSALNLIYAFMSLATNIISPNS